MNAWDRTVTVEGDSPATLLRELKDVRPHGFHGMAVVSITMSAPNRDAFVAAIEELRAPPSETVIADLWQDLIEKDDRTSPAEYPDHALITFDEFAAYIAAACQPASE